jgi:hypothetical protein
MRLLALLSLTSLLVLAQVPAARAHCDSVGGPVASAALRALESGNINLILPFVPAAAETELTDAYNHSRSVRVLTPDAKDLSDRYFMETAVRLHRVGEGAPYTGLKPAGTDFGPAIPAAEQALERGSIEPLAELLSEELMHALAERFEGAKQTQTASKEPVDAAGVAAARSRVGAELGFIGYVEAIYLAIMGGAPHAEGGQKLEQHADIAAIARGC